MFNHGPAWTDGRGEGHIDPKATQKEWSFGDSSSTMTSNPKHKSRESEELQRILLVRTQEDVDVLGSPGVTRSPVETP
ncbi:hypothetical protein AV530_000396 [Patagioenas fasciata monilis]|uniref:Uncharacterized protein n=1 Tax=Patagioenas fasciata monilis TaxID=372326 RepID=A0A1V4IHT0_PATFA|nr:hypothetical protein AV530_000396 [Patagioenas fasciata monilis]